MDELKQKIGALAAEWEAWRNQQLSKRFAKYQPEKVEVRYSKNWAKFVVNEAAMALIAIQDGHNSTVGNYRKGDIFMPASWSTPAKHKRGSVFSEKPMACFTPYGVKYLSEM